MTDHNAEGGKKVEPCAVCGALPDLEQYGEYFASPCGCLILSKNWIYLGAWNDIHSTVAEMRRRDFDAGYALAADHEGNESAGFNSFEEYLAKDRS